MNEHGREPVHANRTCRVVADHTPPSLTPLITVRGDIVTLENRKSEWKGWIWGVTSTGVGGWIPEKYIKRDGDKGIMLYDYDATELTVRVGDRLTVLDEESGWLLCRNSDGRLGWVPATNVYF